MDLPEIVTEPVPEHSTYTHEIEEIEEDIEEIEEEIEEIKEIEEEIEEYPEQAEHAESIEIIIDEAGEEENDSPIEEVRLTVPINDDPTLPCLTIRTWVLGITSCIILSVLNQFFAYRNNFLSIAAVAAQIKVLPLGKMMATYLPKRDIRIPGVGSFSLNPGPFSSKEHCLISVLVSAGSSDILATGIFTMVKVFYHHKISLVPALLLTLTTQMLGYGWAGVFRKFLVDSPYMWWPDNLVKVSFFRVMHEKEERRNGGLKRVHFFIIVIVSSFCYHIVPLYLFQSVTALSVICWIWRDSVTAQQIGAGHGGLGVGSIAFDWSTITDILGSPMATPSFAVVNMLVGFILQVYIVAPIAYWCNLYNAKKFPIVSQHIFDDHGNRYNLSRILDESSEFNAQRYKDYSKINLSISSVLAYGALFAGLAATVSHVALFHGRSFWQQLFEEKLDVHGRLMRKSYEPVPQWWFYVFFIPVLLLSMFACKAFESQLQLPLWGLFLAIMTAFIFTLPIGAIVATTNQKPGIKIASELIIGYINPGRPIANAFFKCYCNISMARALMCLGDLKLAQYMKIPMKSMFLVKLVGELVSLLLHFGTSWLLLSSVDNMCKPSMLSQGSPWACPQEPAFYHNSVVWDVIGPLHLFDSYRILNLFFFIGLVAPLAVWFLARTYKEKKWIRLIHFPILLAGTGSSPFGKVVQFNSWFLVAVMFNVIIYRRYKGWWAKHTYILSAGLDAGLAFMNLLWYFALQSRGIPEWWGSSGTDHCALASCPTEPGIRVEGCPLL